MNFDNESFLNISGVKYSLQNNKGYLDILKSLPKQFKDHIEESEIKNISTYSGEIAKLSLNDKNFLLALYVSIGMAAVARIIAEKILEEVVSSSIKPNSLFNREEKEKELRMLGYKEVTEYKLPFPVTYDACKFDIFYFTNNVNDPYIDLLNVNFSDLLNILKKHDASNVFFKKYLNEDIEYISKWNRRNWGCLSDDYQPRTDKFYKVKVYIEGSVTQTETLHKSYNCCRAEAIQLLRDRFKSSLVYFKELKKEEIPLNDTEKHILAFIKSSGIIGVPKYNIKREYSNYKNYKSWITISKDTGRHVIKSLLDKGLIKKVYCGYYKAV